MVKPFTKLQVLAIALTTGGLAKGLGLLGDLDTVCGIVGVPPGSCGSEPVVSWLFDHLTPTFLVIGVILFLIGERKRTAELVREKMLAPDLDAEPWASTRQKINAIQNDLAQINASIDANAAVVSELKILSKSADEQIFALGDADRQATLSARDVAINRASLSEKRSHLRTIALLLRESNFALRDESPTPAPQQIGNVQRLTEEVLTLARAMGHQQLMNSATDTRHLAALDQCPHGQSVALVRSIADGVLERLPRIFDTER